MCIPCLDPMKNPADLNTTDLDTNKGLVRGAFSSFIKQRRGAPQTQTPTPSLIDKIFLFKKLDPGIQIY